ncbi:chitinase 2-like [Hibiscus syriacus]|nr:chitinase 2-like [Hibiscus syriacus]
MMEYIGATGAPVKLDAVPIEDGIDFRFLLSFAIDSDPSGNAQDGKFSPYWANTLTPESIAAIKQSHPNVKALASISGCSWGNKVLRWYNPVDVQRWISNAVTSLSSIARQYHLNSIDFDYENFPRRDSTFTYCIGELITLLKNQSVISLATIAPYHKTTAPYIELFEKYGDVIDFVNYQFYTDKVRKPRSYVEAFELMKVVGLNPMENNFSSKD